jgi:hypothetical protein
VHSLSLWLRDDCSLELYDYWLGKLRGSAPDAPFMEDVLGFHAFDFFGDWETHHGDNLLVVSMASGLMVTDVDSEVVAQSSLTDDESVYQQNETLWSEFVMSVAHLAALEQADTTALRHTIECNTNCKGAGVEKMNNTQSLQRTASSLKDRTQLVPKSMVIRVKINGHTVKALVDSGSTADIISSALVDQLKIKRIELEMPVPLNMAVQGSRSKINCGVVALFEFDSISTTHYFDVANIANSDVILGTPWLYQHKVGYRLNLPVFKVGSRLPVEIQGKNIEKLQSNAAQMVEHDLDRVHEHLHAYAESKGLYADPRTSTLLLLRAINHEISLIDEGKIYPWHPSRCPDVFKAQWALKKQQYLETRRWRITTTCNTVPLLCIPKPNKPKDKPELRTAIDLRARNANTHKLSAPLLNRQCVRGATRSHLMALPRYARQWEK